MPMLSSSLAAHAKDAIWPDDLDNTWTDQPWTAENMWRRYRFAPPKLSIVQLSPRYTLEYWLLVIIKLDLFSLYKDIHKHAESSRLKYRSYRHPHLLARPHHKLGPAWFRHYIVRFFRILLYYTFVKTTIYYSIHVAKSGLNYDMNQDFASLPYERPARDHIDIARALGEPWACLLYILGNVSLFYFCYLPGLMSYYPGNAPIYRYLVEPWRELERLLLDVDGKLKEIVMNALSRQCMHETGGSIYQNRRVRDISRQCLELRLHHWLCRPEVFSSQGFVDVHNTGVRTIGTLAPIGVTFYFSVFTTMLIWIGIDWFNLLIIFETMVLLFAWVTGVIFIIAVVFLVTRHQTRFMCDLRRDIVTTIQGLRIEATVNVSNIDDRTTTGSIDAELLRVLIKTQLCFEEVCNYQHVLTQIVQICTVIILLPIVLLLVYQKSKLKGPNPTRVYSLIALTLWLLWNVFLLWCADYYAKILKSSRVAASIVCEAQYRADRLGRINTACDFIEGRWRKLVLSDSLTGKHLAVQILGAAVTFRQILELNYAAATILAYLRVV